MNPKRKAKKALAPTDRARVEKSIARSSRTSGRQLEQWTASAAIYASGVARSAGNEHAAFDGMFWIRAYGVLVEVRDHFAELDATVAGHQNEAPGGAVPIYRRWFAAILGAIAGARTALTDDELLYFEYRRHVECHIFQTQYNLRVARDGMVVERRRSNILSRDMTIEDTDAAIQRVLQRYRGETTIAVDIAKRTARHLALVAALVKAYARADHRSFALGPPKVRETRP